MKAVLVFVFAGLLACQATAAKLSEVPVVGAMTQTSCDVRLRVDGAGTVQIEYADNSSFANALTVLGSSPSASNGYTSVATLTGLTAGTAYWHRVTIDGVVQSTGYVHRFWTLPTDPASFTVAVFADVAPRDNAARAYGNASDDGARLALQIGDLDHRDPTTLAEMRTMHREMKDPSKLHGADFVQRILSKMPVVHVWDDHDYGGNDTDKTFTGRSSAWQAFAEHWPTYPRPNPSAGLWHSFEIGDAEFFVLDLRSQRDPNSDTDNAAKSMLDGDEISNDQKDWLKVGLLASTATWKFLVSSVTFNPTARPTSTDQWKSFATERDELANFITANMIENVIALTGDLHTGGAIDDGTNSGLGVPELCVPHTNLARGNTSNLGTWSEGVTSGAKGYGLVTITPSSVTLEAYGANGALRHELTL